jgi:Uma2 family endonuclease
MASVPLHEQQRMSVGQFRQFIEGRPDKERWELIDGVAMMMAPPTPAHQRIASNLERLLLDALEAHAPALTAFQAIGVNVGPAVEDYDPEPDVVVTDSSVEEVQDERYTDRFYLAAEIIASSERVDIDRKRSIYKLHDPCNCILTVQQDRFEVRIDLRTDTGRTEQVLKRPDELLALPA